MAPHLRCDGGITWNKGSWLHFGLRSFIFESDAIDVHRYCLNFSFKLSTNIMSGIQVHNLQEVFPRLDPGGYFQVDSGAQ